MVAHNVVSLTLLQGLVQSADDFVEVGSNMGDMVGSPQRVICPAVCDDVIRHAHIVLVLRQRQVPANAYSLTRGPGTACHQVLVVQPRWFEE